MEYLNGTVVWTAVADLGNLRAVYKRIHRYSLSQNLRDHACMGHNCNGWSMTRQSYPEAAFTCTARVVSQLEVFDRYQTADSDGFCSISTLTLGPSVP